jgi:hypothetical protein
VLRMTLEGTQPVPAAKEVHYAHSFTLSTPPKHSQVLRQMSERQAAHEDRNLTPHPFPLSFCLSFSLFVARAVTPALTLSHTGASPNE